MQRYNNNPILSPLSQNTWESFASFNGSVVQDNSTTHLLYRAMSQNQRINGKELKLSVIGHAKSQDGFNFEKRELFLNPVEEWEKYGLEDPRITKIDNEFFVFYTALSDFPPYPTAIKIGVANFKDFNSPIEKHLVTPFNSKAMVLFPKRIKGKYMALLTANTDTPPSRIALASFENKEEIWSQTYWRKWYQQLNQNSLPLQRMNSDQLEVGSVPLETEYGWLFIYAHIQHYYNPDHRIFGIEAVILDYDNPQKIIARSEKPLLIPSEKYEMEGIVPNVVFPSGGLIKNENLFLYYGATDTTCCVASLPLKDVYKQMKTTAVTALKVDKSSKNPLLEPISEHLFEEKAVFNPAAILEGKDIYLLYRAMSAKDVSTFGLARLENGDEVLERLDKPIYIPRKDFEKTTIPNASSGCEDPRLIKIEDKFYMCYTAYDGDSLPRVAFSSINANDFLNRRFLWSEPVLISPPGIDDKDASFFPEKIKDKFVILHRTQNSIAIDYLDDLNFNGERWLRSIDYITPKENSWDSAKIGIASPPIKTKHGWLLLYHGISKISREYRIGAMLLDLLEPKNVLARTDYPILEPEATFEREGIVENVVFPCGTVVLNNRLYIYYGGADKVLCSASIDFDKLINYLLEIKSKKFIL